MYKHVIEIRNGVPHDVLKKIAVMAERAFNNRAGRVRNTSVSPYKFIFEGGEKDYGCLEVGMLALKREKLFMSCVSSWDWVDDDPSESCDVLEVFAMPVR